MTTVMLADPETGNGEKVSFLDLIPRILSISKSIRLLVGLKLDDLGVLPGQDQLLLLLLSGGSKTLSDVAMTLSVRTSTISKMAGKLKGKGWVTKLSDTNDARHVGLRLTTEGRVVAEAVQVVHAKLDAELSQALGVSPQILSTVSKLDEVIAQRLSRLR